MAQYRVIHGETLYDVAAKLYKDMPLGLSDLLSLNAITLETDINGMDLTYTEGLQRKKPVFLIEERVPIYQYTTRALQSVYDLAVQLHGNLSRIGEIIKVFPNLDEPIAVGSPLHHELSTDPIAGYFNDRGIIVGTDLLEVGLEEEGVFDRTFDRTFN